MPNPSSVLFLDFQGTLIRETDEGRTVLNRALDLVALSSEARLGILTHLPSTLSRSWLLGVLDQAGWRDRFEADLILSARETGANIPQRRAYAVAAALADVPINRCTFVSTNATSVVGAIAAGMNGFKVGFEPGMVLPMTPSIGMRTTASSAVLTAGEINEDTGPTFILKGRLATMKSENDIIPNGRIVISKGKIEHVLAENDPVPEPFASAREINTRGTIYPGLFDLHNHFVYNVLPLWIVPKRYSNRSQWPRHREYKLNVSRPIRRVLAKFSPSSKALVRFVEAKALLRGTTTGQGIRTQVRGGAAQYRGAIRSVEETNDPRLPEARTMVPNLIVTGSTAVERIQRFQAALDDTEARGAGYFYHLSEGIDDSARQHFLNLSDNSLVQKSLVGIHSLALGREDLGLLAVEGAKIVWSPFSNMLLYGRTIELENLKASGVNFCIGCDWSPTGSKNLLQELKVAAFESKRQGDIFSPFELVQAVTSRAALVAGWNRALGSIRPGLLADLVVIRGAAKEPYQTLIDATEPDVKLVLVHGVARYGDDRIMKRIAPVSVDSLEEWEVGGKKKAFHLHSPSSPINDVSFSGAIAELKRAMKDLPAYRDEMEADRANLMELGMDEPEEFTLVMDNEFDHDDFLAEYDTGEFDEAELFADDDEMAESLDLDDPFVNAEKYWPQIEGQKTIPPELKDALKSAYT